MIAWVSHWLSW